MEPKIVETGQMLLVGLGFYGDPFSLSAGWTEENEIGRLWKRFISLLAQHHGRIKHAKGEQIGYELQVYHEDTPSTGEFEVFVGIEVDDLEDLPLELAVKILPPVTYAVFTLAGDQIGADYYLKIAAEWLPQAGYQSNYRYSLQRYDERFKGIDNLAESVIEVYIPVQSELPDSGAGELSEKSVV